MLKQFLRKTRVLGRQAIGTEPRLWRDVKLPLEFHGNGYCGWSIPSGRLTSESTVVDVGLGVDVSFSLSLMERYGLRVHGFDPTPKALSYAKAIGNPNLMIHPYGLAARDGTAEFHLPDDANYVSGSLVTAEHLGTEAISVPLVGISTLLQLVGSSRIGLLKLDIEGAEYQVIDSAQFANHAAAIDIFCVEFHHRWEGIGVQATLDAVERLRTLGFVCVWRSTSSNEEFTFVRKNFD